MQELIDWHEVNADHGLDLPSWAQLLADLSTDYVDRPLPAPTNVLPTFPTIAEYKAHGELAIRPKTFVMLQRASRGEQLHHPDDARWRRSELMPHGDDVDNFVMQKVVKCHRFWACGGFEVLRPRLTEKAYLCIRDTVRLSERLTSRTTSLESLLRRSS